jgi:hypothetical protein
MDDLAVLFVFRIAGFIDTFYMALMALASALSDLPAREFEGLLQMFLSLLQALSVFPNLIIALAQVNKVICACCATGSAGARM